MLPYITFFGRVIPMYGLMGVGGVALGLIVSVLCCRRLELDRSDCAYLYVYGAVGALVGAKVLYLLTVLPQLLAELPLLWEDPGRFLATYVTGGLVFYGGLLGAVAGAALAGRCFAVRLRNYLPVFVPVFPLIHALGRVGCFCAGCCYGREASWGIAFSNSPFAPNGVPLIPVQLMEAAAEVLIALVLLRYAAARPSPWRLLGAYGILYAPVRFVLEFLRGDEVRGLLWGLSTSQWLSLAVAAASAALLLGPWLKGRIKL